MASGWFAQKQGTTPDILPGSWGIYNEPLNGRSYIGLTVRPDDSLNKSTGQRLNRACIRDLCSSFSVWLVHSDIYAGYEAAIKLRIGLGSKPDDLRQLICHSPAIGHDDRQQYRIEFKPLEEYNHIIPDALSSENRSILGNILIDKMTNIYNCGRA